MTLLAMRALFVVLLLATTAVKLRASSAPELDVRAALIGVVDRHGWSSSATPSELQHPLLDSVSFQAPGCDGLVQIFSVDPNLQMAPLLDQVIGPRYRRTVAYLGGRWSTVDRLGIRLEWLKHRSSLLLGLSRYAAHFPAPIMIAEPLHCQVVEMIDWSQAWVAPR